MDRIRIAPLAITTTLLLVITVGAPVRAASADRTSRRAARPLIVSFATDPTRRPHGRFEVSGPGVDQFTYEGDSRPRFKGDRRGSLAVAFDSLAPTSRYATRLPRAISMDGDFVFGAVLTIRPEGFAADPFGFHPIAFSLFNATSTGDERTGNLTDFRADTFDTVEFSYFPNVSPFFGGPFVSPDVFGEAIDADAFANFAFASIPFELTPGITYLIECEHSAGNQTLTARVWVVHPRGRALPLGGGEVTVDLSGISGFVVDSFGIAAYHDGFNAFSASGRSLLATVDFDLLYAAPVSAGRIPPRLASLLSRLKGDHEIQPRDGSSR